MTDLPRLSDRTLGDLGAGVIRPQYDRATVQTGIVHLGVGAFHRAHQAVFTDDCLNAGETGWGITAASLRSTATRDALGPQDGLYGLAVRATGTEDLRVVGAISKVLVAPENPAALLAEMAAPTTRIVAMTITEKGYCVDAAGALKTDDADIRHDLAHPDSPRTSLGFLAGALAQRRAAGIAPFTILSCDNLSQNGRVLHRALAAFAWSRDAGLGRFVEDDVSCPSCMVDRIAPATTDADRNSVSGRLGVRDAWPVVTEPFHQWVIEDRFPLGRPGWERSGTEFTTDVAPFEAMKLRLLNGPHSTLAAMGRLAGYSTVAEAMANPILRAFIGHYWDQVSLTVPVHIDTAAYTARLAARFDNTALHHKLAQIASDASQKVRPRIIDPLRDLRARRAPYTALTLSLAAWMRVCEGSDDAGRDLPMNDPVLAAWSDRPTRAMSAPDAVHCWLDDGSLFGLELAGDQAFAAELGLALSELRDHGVLHVLTRFLATG